MFKHLSFESLFTKRYLVPIYIIFFFQINLNCLNCCSFILLVFEVLYHIISQDLLVQFHFEKMQIHLHLNYGLFRFFRGKKIEKEKKGKESTISLISLMNTKFSNSLSKSCSISFLISKIEFINFLNNVIKLRIISTTNTIKIKIVFFKKKS